MKKTFLKQLWVALKIWVIALAVNTMGGSIYLVGNIEKSVLIAGLVYGVIFSLPILIILLIVINHCVSRRKNGLDIFQYVFLFGLGMTVFCTVFFLALFQGGPVALLLISVLAATAAIGTQYNALFKLARYDDEYQNFPS